jgi:hypothetical protein
MTSSTQPAVKAASGVLSNVFDPAMLQYFVAGGAAGAGAFS